MRKSLVWKVALLAFSQKQFKYSAKDVASIAAKPKVVDLMASAIERRCVNSADDVGVDHAARRDFVRWCVAEIFRVLYCLRVYARAPTSDLQGTYRAAARAASPLL